jgi:hypothetical protein
MSCPHFKVKCGFKHKTGICKAIPNKVMIPTVQEVKNLCSSEHFDECPFFLDFVSTCTKEKFHNIMFQQEKEIHQ